MASLHIDNLPANVLRYLEQEAAGSSRDLGDVAADRLARSFGDYIPRERRDADELLRLADAVRVGNDEACFTPEFMRLTREDGRA